MPRAKAKTIFVLHGGHYSDYRVMGVFSSRKNANLAKQAMRARDLDVAEWPLDPAVQGLALGHNCYRVVMLRDGSTEEARPARYISDLEPHIYLWKRTEAPAYKGKGIPDVLVAEVWAKDEKHAIKITNEHRAQWIAENKWKVSGSP